MPKNKTVVEQKPEMEVAELPTQIYLEPRLLGGGMWLGFGALTYPTDQLIQATRP